MPICTATLALGSVSGSLLFSNTDIASSNLHSSSVSSLLSPIFNFSKHSLRYCCSSRRTPWVCSANKVTGSSEINGQTSPVLQDSSDPPTEAIRQARRSADWEAARSYLNSGFIFEGRIEGFNGGGLLVRFHSLVGFLPFPQLSPSHFCREPTKSLQEIAKGRWSINFEGSRLARLIKLHTMLSGANKDKLEYTKLTESMDVKTDEDITMECWRQQVIQAHEESRKLIFSEKEAEWSKFSGIIKVGDILEARVGSVEDYGAFVHLRFPDGLYHLTGLVHVSEVSWDLVQDVRDVLTEGDEVKVKIISIHKEKSRITLSIRQLEEDPLLETLEKVIPQDGSVGSDSSSITDTNNIEPLPGLETILEELLQEDGIIDVRVCRQGFEKRVVSQDLQLWLSNAPPINQNFTLLARAGRQVQEIQLTTSLDQEGIKKALQQVLERVP